VPGEFWVRAGEEKGIDVRVTLDMIRLTYRNEFDVGIIFSQDQDLSEAVTEVRAIAKDQHRGVEMFCAFPRSGKTTNIHAIRGQMNQVCPRFLAPFPGRDARQRERRRSE